MHHCPPAMYVVYDKHKLFQIIVQAYIMVCLLNCTLEAGLKTL